MNVLTLIPDRSINTNSLPLNCQSEIPDDDQAFLEAADFLGAKLCRDAIWSGNRCNWIGAKSVRLSHGRQTVAVRACGPDLFDGTTGLAIFLTRLFAVTGDRVFRLTAEGAMRQALSRLDDIPRAVRIGFYKGLTGVAYALTEASELLDIPKFRPMALLLIEEIHKDQTKQEIDVLSGVAGAITPLLSIHNRLSHDLPLELVLQQSERLVDAKLKMSGFAHGIEGIAWALCELYDLIDSNRFRLGAHEFAAQVSENTAPPVYEHKETRWLDGVAGSAMSLIRRFELLSESALLEQARQQVEKIAKRLSAEILDLDGIDYSPAYGISGEAELLLDASTVFNRPDYAHIARRVGYMGIERFRKDDMPWPCGESDGEEHPGLMTGLAGIGHFYLRLFKPRNIPSVMLVRPS